MQPAIKQCAWLTPQKTKERPKKEDPASIFLAFACDGASDGDADFPPPPVRSSPFLPGLVDWLDPLAICLDRSKVRAKTRVSFGLL